MLTTLYIATHNKTGLKYFGQTKKYHTLETLQKYYHGSGTYWKKHLEKHGDNVTMEIYGTFKTKEVTDIALNFSNKNNIVESKSWANLMLENGLDGSVSGKRERTSKTINSKDWLLSKGKEKVKKYSGKNNYQTSKIEIYDNNNELRYVSEGSFTKFCKEHNLPKGLFFRSLNLGIKVLEKQNPKDNGLYYAKKKGNDKYKDWYAIRV